MSKKNACKFAYGKKPLGFFYENETTKSDGSRASSQMKSAIPFSGAAMNKSLGFMWCENGGDFLDLEFGWTVSAVCVFFWWNLVHINIYILICIIYSIIFNVFWRLVNFRVNPTLVDWKTFRKLRMKSENRVCFECPNRRGKRPAAMIT